MRNHVVPHSCSNNPLRCCPTVPKKKGTFCLAYELLADGSRYCRSARTNVIETVKTAICVTSERLHSPPLVVVFTTERTWQHAGRSFTPWPSSDDVAAEESDSGVSPIMVGNTPTLSSPSEGGGGGGGAAGAASPRSPAAQAQARLLDICSALLRCHFTRVLCSTLIAYVQDAAQAPPAASALGIVEVFDFGAMEFPQALGFGAAGGGGDGDTSGESDGTDDEDTDDQEGEFVEDSYEEGFGQGLMAIDERGGSDTGSGSDESEGSNGGMMVVPPGLDLQQLLMSAAAPEQWLNIEPNDWPQGQDDNGGENEPGYEW